MRTYTSKVDDNGIMNIIIDVPGETINVFNQQVIEEFEPLIQEIEDDNKIKAVIISSGKEEGFIAGADLKMLQAAKTEKQGRKVSEDAHRILGRISKSQKPYIIAINGICLGAGYELALACHYRIASDEPATKLGLPEVMVGLLPGGMGNTILPRLIALPIALDILLTGKQIHSKRALRLGMIDEVVPKTTLLKAAKISAKKFITTGVPQRKNTLKANICKLPFIKRFIIEKAKKQVIKKTKGLYPAPLAILEVIENGLNLPLNDALAIEANAFGKLTHSKEARQLINIYFATTALKKEAFTKETISPRTINKLGILGGGLMGAGIATISIEKTSAQVRIKEIKDEGILSVYSHINTYYKKRVKRKILSKEAANKKINRLSSSLDYKGFKQCDLVIEAVFEDLSLKHKMVKEIESLDNSKTIFASNTSSITISDIAKAARYPENIIGMHYFSPVEKMPLLEIIKHEKTSELALASAVEFGRKQGKTVIVVNDGAGFYVNRILAPYLNTALELGFEGIPFDKIDNAMTAFGFPVGPIKLLDEVGIDVASKIQSILEEAFGERMLNNGLQQKLVKTGRLGKKVKKGFYLYNKQENNKSIDPTIYTDLGITKTVELSEAEIINRCIFPMLNEAVAALDENIINSPRDGDIGAIFGIGFPPFLGGPFRYIDTVGQEKIIEILNKLEQRHGLKYKPHQRLIDMLDQQALFYE